MKTRPLYFVVVLLLAVSFTGCSDSLTSPDAAPEAETVLKAADETSSKMRHAHLRKFVQRYDLAGKVLERYEEYATATEFIIGFSDGMTDVQAMAVLERYNLQEGVTVKHLLKKSVNGFSASIDPTQLDRILDMIEYDGDIAWMEPDPQYSFSLPGKTWSMDKGQREVTNLSHVQGRKTSANPGDGQGSVDVDIYILDTGVDHPDLNVVEYVDFTAAGQDVDMTKVLERYEVLERYQGGDGIGHGTHIAGIAAAIDDDDHLVGMAPGARIHDFKVLGNDGTGSFSAVIAALDVIIARKQANPSKPIVVNMSFGVDVGTTEYTALDNAVVEAVNNGVVVVIAAGNDGIDASTVSPAHVTEAITVGATEVSSGGHFSVAPFSNTGDVVDLYASGTFIRSLMPSDYSLMTDMSGTSMAAPLVSGAAALILANRPNMAPKQVGLELLDKADYLGKGKSKFAHLNASSW